MKSAELFTKGVWCFARRARLLPRLAQLIIFILSAASAFLLRFEFRIPAQDLPKLAFAVATWVGIKALVFQLHGLDRGWWRFVSTQDLLWVGRANLIGSLAGGLIIYLFGPSGFPR